MTRAYISVVIDGKVYAAYINHDGYPSFVGSRLMNGYLNPQDPEKDLCKLKTLCSNGEIFNLGSFIRTCSFAGTDSDHIPSREFESLDEFADFICLSLVDYCYIFKDGVWYLVRPVQYLKAVVHSFDRLDLKHLDPSYQDDEYVKRQKA